MLELKRILIHVCVRVISDTGQKRVHLREYYVSFLQNHVLELKRILVFLNLSIL